MKPKFKKKYVLGVGEPFIENNSISMWDNIGEIKMKIKGFNTNDYLPQYRLELHRVGKEKKR